MFYLVVAVVYVSIRHLHAATLLLLYHLKQPELQIGQHIYLRRNSSNPCSSACKLDPAPRTTCHFFGDGKVVLFFMGVSSAKFEVPGHIAEVHSPSQPGHGLITRAAHCAHGVLILHSISVRRTSSAIASKGL